jgi:hypothetical protein
MFENAYPHIAYKFILHITYPFLYLLFFMGKESMECTPRNTIVRDAILLLGTEEEEEGRRRRRVRFVNAVHRGHYP